MITLEQIGILMSEVGPVLDPIAVQAFPEDGCWAVALDDDMVVLVELDERKNSLVLSSELGEPPPGDRLALYEKLLQLNYHWAVTGGNRLAIDGAGGKVVQLFETPAEGLDATRLSMLLAAFARTASAWRQVVQRQASTHSGIPDPGALVGMLV